jgi:predicted dehydrogenase
LWIGPAAKHEYSAEVHPFKWRGYWAFGTGALGDMACHTLNMSYMALDLNNPTMVQATGSEHDKYVYPASSVIEYQFAANDWRPALKLFWYDGGERPLKLLGGCPKDGDGKHFTSGALLIGEKGKFYSPGDYSEMDGQTGVVTEDSEFVQLNDLNLDIDFERAPRGPGAHYEEFANAIRGTGKPASNFGNYAGGLTETVLLGNLAVWASGHRVDWDQKSMTAKATKIDASAADCTQEEIDQIVRHEYRNGFAIYHA